MVFGDKLAEGMFGVVYKGTCRGQTVAIKVLKKFNASLKEEFLAEVEIMAAVVHPHIVLLLGACTDDEKKWSMVTEFCARGDLNGILHGKDKDKLSISKKMHCALDICAGMSWLTGEEVRILHRDLKPANVLVDANWTCKIADFGLSLLKAKGVVKGDDAGGGSPLWMSPEALLEEEKITEKTDVYSFGLVLWEILTQQALFPEYTDLDVFTEDIAKKGVRPILNKQFPLLDDIVVKCWQRDPTKRPSFQELIPMIQHARVDIFLPASLCPDAGVFWKKKWLDKNRVPLDTFMTELFGFLRRPFGTVEHKCVAALFCPPEASASLHHVPHMSLPKFSKLLKWFGPLKNGKNTMLDHLVNTMKQPWFFGAINRQAAEAKLEPYKAKEGTFLVRLNTGTGEPIEVSPYTITRSEGGVFVHNRACPSKKGGFFIKAKTQIRADGTLQDLVQQILMTPDSPCTTVCPGHPFEAIFSTTKGQSKGNYQMNEGEESEDD
jgi:serine/threonine protein kinase